MTLNRTAGFALLFGAAFLAAFLYVAGAPSLEILKTGILNDLGDPLLNFWILEQVRANVLNSSQGLFYGNIFFPYPSSLGFSEGLWIPSIIYNLFRAAVAEPIFAYNLTIFSLFALNFTAMVFFARRFLDMRAALFAGMIFSFSMLRIAQLSHLQLLPQFFFPLAAGAIWDYESSGRRRDLTLALMFVVGQFYACMYLGFFLVVTLLPYFTVRSLKTQGRRSFLWHLIPAGALAGLLVAPLGIKYISVSRETGMVRTIQDAYVYGAHITHYIAAHPKTFWGPITEPLLKAKGQLHEKRLFMGAITLFLIAFALYARRKKLTKRTFWFVVLLSTFILVVWISLGPQARLYNLFFYGFPGFKGMRVPARFGLSFLFVCSIVAGLGVNSLLKRFNNRTVGTTVLGVLAALFLFENRLPLDFEQIPTALVPVTEALTRLPDREPVLHVPMESRDTVRMYYSLSHGHPLFNGYSGYIPDPYRSMAKQEQASGPTLELIEKAKGLGVKYCVVENARWLALLQAKYPLLWKDETTALFRIADDG